MATFREFYQLFNNHTYMIFVNKFLAEAGVRGAK